MKMLKNKLRIVLVIVITAILVGGISVYATYNYLASEVKYTKEDGTEINVSEALDELYNRNFSNNKNELLGKNNKRYRLFDDILNDESIGYIPTLTSNNSCSLGTASSNVSNAWYAFDNNEATGTYYESENISTGYVQFSTNGILIKVKKMTASIMCVGKNYNYYLQYWDIETNQWITLKNGTITPYLDWGNPTTINAEMENDIYTTKVRVYTDTKKTSGNNFRVTSFQVYP